MAAGCIEGVERDFIARRTYARRVCGYVEMPEKLTVRPLLILSVRGRRESQQCRDRCECDFHGRSPKTLETAARALASISIKTPTLWVRRPAAQSANLRYHP